MANYYDPLQFGGFMPDPYAAPNKSAGGANPYTLALLQAVGGLMTPGPYYGAFGGQVGQAATAGAQGMGQVQRLELLRKQQEAEDAYRRGVLGVKQSELSEDQRQFDKSMDLAKGIFPEYFGGQQPAQQPATPNVMSQGFEPQTNMFGLDRNSAPSYANGPQIGAVGTIPQVPDAFINRATGERSSQAGFETIQAPGQAPQSVIGAAKQRVTADNEAADLMRRGAALSFVNKDAGKAIQDYAKFLQTDANEQRKFEQGKTEIDPYGIRIDTVNDTESVLEPDGQGGFKLRQIGTEEANRIRNKGREAAASKINVDSYEKGQERIMTEQATAVIDNYQALQNATPILRNMERAKELAKKSKGFVGSFGDTKLSIIKFFNNNLGTAIAPSQVKNAEALKTSLFMQVIENLRKVDATPSQAQQMMLQQAMGNIGSDPDAIPLMLDVYEQILRDKVEQHNFTAGQMYNNPNFKPFFGFDPRIDLPESSKEPAREIKWEDL